MSTMHCPQKNHTFILTLLHGKSSHYPSSSHPSFRTEMQNSYINEVLMHKIICIMLPAKLFNGKRGGGGGVYQRPIPD